MNIGQGAGRAALLCAALVSSASACASSSTASTAVSTPSSAPSTSASALPSPSPSGPVSGADALAAKAIANLKAATSVHVVATARKPGSGMDWNLTLFPGHGCTGSGSMGSQGTVQFTIIGTNLWYKPDSTYWRTAGVAPTTLKTIKDRYLHTTTDAKGTAMALGVMCSLDDGIYGSAETAAAGLTATTTALNGQSALKLTATDGTDAMVVTRTASPRLLQILDTTSDGNTMTFTDYNTSSNLTPPPAGQTLNASSYGL